MLVDVQCLAQRDFEEAPTGKLTTSFGVVHPVFDILVASGERHSIVTHGNCCHLRVIKSSKSRWEGGEMGRIRTIALASIRVPPEDV